MIFRRAVLAVLLLLSLSACSGDTSEPAPPAGVVDYEKFGITRLKVGEIQIVNSYQPTYHAPHVEHELLRPPYTMVRDWARNRYEAVGNMGVLKIDILDASIVERDVPVKSDIFDDIAIHAEYKLRLYVRMEINSPNYIDLPYAETVVTRVMYLSPDDSVETRNAMLASSLVEAINKLNALMTQTIRNKWGNIVE